MSHIIARSCRQLLSQLWLARARAVAAGIGEDAHCCCGSDASQVANVMLLHDCPARAARGAANRRTIAQEADSPMADALRSAPPTLASIARLARSSSCSAASGGAIVFSTFCLFAVQYTGNNPKLPW